MINIFKKKKFTIPFLLLVILGAAFFIFGNKPEDPAQKYRLQPIEKSALLFQVNATGTLEPVMVVKVGTQVSGTVKELYVDYNDHVKAEQVLLQLDDEPYRAKVNYAQGVLDSTKAKLKLAQLRVNRYQSLYGGRTATKEELDKATADRDMAQAEMAQAQAQLDIDKYNLKNTRIISPVDGVVTNRVIDVGQTVAASFQTPDLIEIARDLTKMQIDANFAEADVGQLTPGLEAQFTVDTFPNRTFTGTIRQVRLNPTTEQNVVTYHVIIDVDNPDLKLLPGMTAYVDIELYREDDVLLVPNTALNFRPSFEKQEKDAAKETIETKSQEPETDPPGSDKKGQAWALKDGQLKKINLTLGATNLRQTVVKAGDLKSEDLVAVGEKMGVNSGKDKKK